MDLRDKFLSSIYLFLEENGFSTSPISKDIVINNDEYSFGIFAYSNCICVNLYNWSSLDNIQFRFEIVFDSNSLESSIKTLKKLITDIDIIVNKLNKDYPYINLFNFSSNNLFIFSSYINGKNITIDIDDT